MEQMDVDFLSYSPETQVDLMNMMLQLQELADLSETLQPPSAAGLQEDHFGLASPTTPPSPMFAAAAGPQTALSSLDANTAAGHDPYFMAPPSPNNPQPSGVPALAQWPTSTAAMREMIFRLAAMQPVHIDPESVKPPKRRNVRISKDPQSVAARLRRERISERMRILQHMVPGGTKMDTASMLDEAIHYVKFLKTQVRSLERAAVSQGMGVPGLPPPAAAAFVMPPTSVDGGGSYSCYQNMYQMQAADQWFMNSSSLDM